MPYRIIVGNNPINYTDPLGFSAIAIPSRSSFNDLLNSMGLGDLPAALKEFLYGQFTDPNIGPIATTGGSCEIGKDIASAVKRFGKLGLGKQIDEYSNF